MDELNLIIIFIYFHIIGIVLREETKELLVTQDKYKVIILL